MSVLRLLLELQHRAWSVALRAALLPADSLFRRTDRHLTWKLWEVTAGAHRPGVSPEVGLGAISGSDSVTLQCLPNETYNVTELELLAVSAIVRQRRARVVLEFGTAVWHDALRFDVQTALPRLARTSGLPIHLISGTNVAALFFLDGHGAEPATWAQARRS